MGLFTILTRVLDFQLWPIRRRVVRLVSHEEVERELIRALDLPEELVRESEFKSNDPLRDPVPLPGICEVERAKQAFGWVEEAYRALHVVPPAITRHGTEDSPIYVVHTRDALYQAARYGLGSLHNVYRGAGEGKCNAQPRAGARFCHCCGREIQFGAQ